MTSVSARGALVAITAATVCALPVPASAVGTTCGTVRGGASATRAAHLTAVRTGHHRGFDRVVLQFDSPRVPRYAVVPKASSVFWLDPSNRRVRLLGSAGLKITLQNTTGQGTYRGPLDLRPRHPQLREVRRIGDFEAVSTWGVGLAHPSCKRVFTLTSPARLVVDVPVR